MAEEVTNSTASLDAVRQALRETGELLYAANRAHDRASAAFERTVQTIVKAPFEAAPECSVQPTDHRRNHRPGRPPKIESDFELQAFIRARIDRLTFMQITAEVAATFPPDRRVGKSAIHAWWQRTQNR